MLGPLLNVLGNGSLALAGLLTVHRAVAIWVTGQVVAWPCALVENPQTVCSQRPVADQPVIFTSGSGQDMTTQTDSNGNYAAELPVGTWKVSFKGYMRIISGPESVTIKGGEGVVANYVLDSGIRLPAASPVD